MQKKVSLIIMTYLCIIPFANVNQKNSSKGSSYTYNVVAHICLIWNVLMKFKLVQHAITCMKDRQMDKITTTYIQQLA